ncbi:hypothetical protein Dimus_012657 [Dionaea muscipula]
MPGIVAARRSLWSEDQRDKSGPPQSGAPKLMPRFPGSLKESSVSLTRQDEKPYIHGAAGPHHHGNGKANSKDPVLLGYGSKGNKIHYSGPLLVPSSNADEVLKDHDRQIQEAVRRARLDKAKAMRKMQVEGNQPSTTSY